LTTTTPTFADPATNIAQAARPAGIRLARLVSNVLSPPVVALPVLVIGVRLSGVPGAWRFGALYAVLAIVVPMVDLLYLLRTGRVGDFHLSLRGERTRPFVVSIACTGLAAVALAALGAPPLLVALGVATFGQAVVLFAITLRWQVSVHSAAVAGLAALSVMAYGAPGALAAPLVALVGWARLRLDRHTPAQVLVGVAIGAVAVVAALTALA